jgi:hypothetical protein
MASNVTLMFGALALAAGPALAAEPLPAPGGTEGSMLGPASLVLQPASTEAPETPRDPAPARALRFGDKGSWYWAVHAGAAFSSEATEPSVQFSLGTFLTDNFEFNFGLAGWHHAQDGDDAQSINPGFGFRYHFAPSEVVNPYIDVGIGLLFSTDDVPDDGTSVNFTPHAGGGVLWRLDPATGLRLDTGLRWHHISNATVSGSDDNPSRDGVFVYVGLVFPF